MISRRIIRKIRAPLVHQAHINGPGENSVCQYRSSTVFWLNRASGELLQRKVEARHEIRELRFTRQYFMQIIQTPYFMIINQSWSLDSFNTFKRFPPKQLSTIKAWLKHILWLNYTTLSHYFVPFLLMILHIQPNLWISPLVDFDDETNATNVVAMVLAFVP